MEKKQQQRPKVTITRQKEKTTAKTYPDHQCLCCLKTFVTEKEALAHMFAQHHK